MRIALGVILIILGLCVIQFSGIMTWHPSGGIDFEDLLSFKWLSNIGGRMRGDGGLFIGVGILGFFMLGGGIFKLARAKKEPQPDSDAPAA